MYKILFIYLTVILIQPIQAQDDIKIKDTQEGIFVDLRDGQSYNFKTYGTQCWMTQNLNYDCDGSYFNPEDSVANMKKGRFYNMKSANSACPDGWHLPSNQEWETFAQYISEVYGPFAKKDWDWEKIGEILLEPSLKDRYSLVPDIGFKALWTGEYVYMNNRWVSSFKDSETAWWSSSVMDYHSNWIWSIKKIDPDPDMLYNEVASYRSWLTIRCIKNK